MSYHCIFFIICIIFINNVSSAINSAESTDVTEITTNIKNAVNSIKNSLIDEQLKTSTELYDDENLGIITSSGDYHYTGELTTVTIQKNSGTVHLYLENAKFSSPGDKIIDSKNGVNLIITLIGENMISNPSETSSNAISVNQDITINGQGSLTIISSKNGIKCDGKLFGLGGTLNIQAQNHGISVDSVYLDGMNINIEETSGGKDGIHAETDYDGVSEVPSFDFLKGFVYIQSGTINIQKCSGDGIQADSFVYIKDGNINIKTEATWETFVATENGMKGCYSKSGDTYSKVASDNVRRGSTYYILSNSCKGIKVGEIDYFLIDDETETEQIVTSSSYTLLIEGGTIEINSSDDSIHSNSGNSLIYGGKIKISTLDDGITADLNLIVKDGEIDIKTCYEGLEAKMVEISGGSIKIVADDDGINAPGDRSSQILFSGGETYVYAKGDGIDSNGNIVIDDGEIYVLQTSGWNGALDSDGEILINGGKVVAVGSSSMPEIPSSSSKQCVIVRQIQSTSEDISLKDSNGDTILSFQISSIFDVKVSYSLVVLSSNSIKKCQSYDIVTGGSSDSVLTSGSSNVTSNARPGWGGGGGSSSNNDGDNCPNNPSSGNNKDKSLSTGGIIGIVVACVVVVALVVGLLVYFFVYKKKTNVQSSKDEGL